MDKLFVIFANQLSPRKQSDRPLFGRHRGREEGERNLLRNDRFCAHAVTKVLKLSK